MSDKKVEAKVARRMCRQLSQITKAQAIACGMTDGQIRVRCDSGLWVVVAGGLYRAAEASMTWEQRTLGACLLAGPEAVASHRSAAVVWELSGIRAGRSEITVPMGRSSRNTSASVHRTYELPRADVTRRHGIPVTRPARTLVDLAAVVSIAVLEEAVDDALIRRLVPLEGLRARSDVERGRGSRALRRVLEVWPPGPLPGSLQEMRVTRWLHTHGVPLGERQFVIRTEAGRFLARVDRAWPAYKVALEVESMRWHGTPRGLARDDVRYPKIRALGWTLFSKEVGDDLTDLLHAIERAERAA